MKKSYFLLFLGIGGFIIIMLFLLNRKSPLQNNPTSEPRAVTATPTYALPTLTPYPEVPQALITPILPLLPFENEQFLVEYLPKIGEFYVSIKPGATNYAAAVAWLSKQGIPSPENNAQVRFLFLENY